MKVTVVIREPGRIKPDYSLEFELPHVPSVGDYISVFRPDAPTHSEDIIVRHVWWHLYHPETRAVFSGHPRIGKVQDVIVECDIAIGPYAPKNWRQLAEGAKAKGCDVPDFKVSRLAFPEQ